jgi:hypothetical protein
MPTFLVVVAPPDPAAPPKVSINLLPDLGRPQIGPWVLVGLPVGVEVALLERRPDDAVVVAPPCHLPMLLLFVLPWYSTWKLEVLTAMEYRSWDAPV